MVNEKQIDALTSPIERLDYRTPREVFDIMCARIITAADQAEPCKNPDCGCMFPRDCPSEPNWDGEPAPAALEPAEPATDAEPVEWRTVQKKFYHSQWATAKLLEARDGGLVTDDGEAWFYEHTSKDGTGGSYDMLFRRVYTRPPESDGKEARE